MSSMSLLLEAFRRTLFCSGVGWSKAMVFMLGDVDGIVDLSVCDRGGCGMVVVAWWLWHGGCGMVVVAWWLWHGGCGVASPSFKRVSIRDNITLEIEAALFTEFGGVMLVSVVHLIQPTKSSNVMRSDAISCSLNRHGRCICLFR
jgi:hypothetical protein